MFEKFKKLVSEAVNLGSRGASASSALPSSGYSGATGGRRAANLGGGISRGQNSLTIAEGTTLVRRSRKLSLNNPAAVAAIDAFVSNAVGTGIVPHPTHPKEKVRKKLRALWEEWGQSADADGLVDVYGQQSIACRNVLVAGEMFGRFRPRRLSDGLPLPFQVQMIDPEQLPFYFNGGSSPSDGNIIRGGVEFDTIGRRVAYHFYKAHPGDADVWPDAFELTRVLAAEALHVFRVTQARQIRGTPWLAPVIIRLADLDEYTDATIMRTKIANKYVGTIRNISPDESVLGVISDQEGNQLAPDGVSFANVEPGTIVELGDNELLEFNNPPGVDTSYEGFLKANLHQIAAAAGVTYEQITGDWSNVTYSSARLAGLEFRRRVEQFQFQTLVHQWCKPTWRQFIYYAILAGKIDAADFAKDSSAYLNCEWRTPKWAYTDPLKDIGAEQLAVRCGFKSSTQVILDSGEDPEQVRSQIAADNAENDRLGLISEADPRKTTGGKSEKAGNQASNNNSGTDNSGTDNNGSGNAANKE